MCFLLSLATQPVGESPQGVDFSTGDGCVRRPCGCGTTCPMFGHRVPRDQKHTPRHRAPRALAPRHSLLRLVWLPLSVGFAVAAVSQWKGTAFGQACWLTLPFTSCRAEQRRSLPATWPKPPTGLTEHPRGLSFSPGSDLTRAPGACGVESRPDCGAACGATWRQCRALCPTHTRCFPLERCLEDHELVVQVQTTMASESKFLFRKNYGKYEFFKNPTVSLGSGGLGGSPRTLAVATREQLAK